MRLEWKSWKNLFCLILFFLMSDCASGVGHNIKLDKFPEAKDVSDLDVHKYVYKDNAIQMKDAKKYGFRPLVWGKVEKYKYPTEEQIKSQKQALFPKSGCVLDVEYGGKYAFNPKGTFGKVYQNFSGITFYIIPYFLPGNKTISAALVDASNNKVLKEYFFEEKTVKSIALLPIFWILYWNYDSAGESAQNEFNAQRKLDKALIRTVTNDIYNFPECRKK